MGDRPLSPEDPTYAGQAVYTRRTLRAYDPLVLGLSNRLIWRCPTATLLAHYDAHVSHTHLEVGPGSGYFLDRCSFPDGAPEITLLDANVDVLTYAAARIRRYQPRTHAADVLAPISLEPGSFGSIGLNYVLHCLPGDIPAKSVVLRTLRPLLRPGGVLFGSTVLAEGVSHTPLSRGLMAVYNRRGIFGNAHDRLADLDAALGATFDRHRVTVHGAVAVFAAFVPGPDAGAF